MCTFRIGDYDYEDIINHDKSWYWIQSTRPLKHLPNILQVLFVQPKQLWPVKAWSQDLLGYPVVSGNRAFVVDPFGLGSLEAGSTPWALCCIPHAWAVSVVCQGKLSCWSGHCHQGVPLSWGGVLGPQQWSTWIPGLKVSHQKRDVTIS